ncbi:MAG TPA: hypothetical protein VE545_04090, partial [Candidatus Dormibacteraeota bacterium]|nr:hypothetical protein [Candidatus Dormibacteraeota bacterium]
MSTKQNRGLTSANQHEDAASETIDRNAHNHDGVDRRGFLKCMAWAGTGALCVMQGGVLKSYALGTDAGLRAYPSAGQLSFV